MSNSNLQDYPDKFTALNSLVPEKVEQAIGLLNELDIDLWLTFTQKMGDTGGDPVYSIIFGERDLGRGILLLSKTGEHIAIVGGNVFTAEGLETFLENRGWISLEDDVLVTQSGHEILTTQQREIWLV